MSPCEPCANAVQLSCIVAVGVQAAIYEETLNPIRNKYGYSAAVWCAFWSVRMTGQEFDAKSDQRGSWAERVCQISPASDILWLMSLTDRCTTTRNALPP